MLSILWNTLLLQPLVNGLLIFYRLFFSDLGLAIIALTLFIKLVLLPVTIPSMKSMQKMRDLAPELAKLKKRHKDDKTKLMQAQSDLYKSRGVSPTAGCLPQLVQLVVLIALYGVFGLFASGDPTVNINNYAYPTLHLTDALNTHFLYLDLTKPDVFHLSSIPFPLPGPLLITAAIFQLLSSKMMLPEVKKEKELAEKTKGDIDDIMVSTQKQMLYFFPVMTLFIGFSFASGLVLYWLVIAVIQMVQQYFVSGWGGLNSWLLRLNLIKS